MSAHATPLISVLLPARNAARYIDEAMESILSQTERNLEVIVVNDGSSDDTGERLNAWSNRDSRCRVFQAQGLGPAGALNVCIDQARGTFFARMDADDVSLLNRFRLQLLQFERNPRLVACGTWARTFGDAGSHVWRPPVTNGGLSARMLFDSPLVHPTVMMRRDALRGFLTVYRTEFGRAEDYDLWERLQQVGELRNVPNVLLRYRMHAAQVTVTSRSDSVAGAEQVRTRILRAWWPESSTEELAWHHAFCAELLPPSKETLTRAEKWLSHLDRQHQTRPRATPAEWRAVLASRWWEVCHQCRGLGPSVFARFIRSPLGGLTSVPARRILRLAAESARVVRTDQYR